MRAVDALRADDASVPFAFGGAPCEPPLFGSVRASDGSAAFLAGGVLSAFAAEGDGPFEGFAAGIGEGDREALAELAFRDLAAAFVTDELDELFADSGRPAAAALPAAAADDGGILWGGGGARSLGGAWVGVRASGQLASCDTTSS